MPSSQDILTSVTACHSKAMAQKSTKWNCITNCGACCRLAPEERAEAIASLRDEEVKVYLDLVKPDGWCRHYDSGRRICKVYEDRPSFCKTKDLTRRFDLNEDVSSDFLINCCRQNIRSVYGGKSTILKRFNMSQIQKRQR